MLREACAEDGLGFAFLAIALDDEPGQRAGQEHQLVPVRDLLEHREAAHPVPAELGLHVDVVDHLGREYAAVPEYGPAAVLARAHLRPASRCFSAAPAAEVFLHCRAAQRTSLRSDGSRLS